MAEEYANQPMGTWTESHVSSWLKSIGIGEKYIQKIQDEEVNGQILLEVTEAYLEKKIGMKSGPIHLLIRKRDEMIRSLSLSKHQVVSIEKPECYKEKQRQRDINSETETTAQPATATEAPQSGLSAKRDCKPRPFGKEGIDFAYVKHNVLLPESGVIDLITPCHEYKSFATAAVLDRTRLQAKLAKEVFKFACGCMNVRSNGTIHFGVMDSRNDSGYVHGEIIGVPIKETDMYVDALDYMERSFKSDFKLVAQCIRPPQFIEVPPDSTSPEKSYVVEYDIVPSIAIVANRLFSVCLPNFKESTNKVEFEKKTMYWRSGSKTEPVSNQEEFYSSLKHRDDRRKQAENDVYVLNVPNVAEDLGRKLSVLITDGKNKVDTDKWHIIVTNQFQKEHLNCTEFLLNLKIFCVFDFDPDSKKSGFCKKYLEHHAANLHFLKDYKISTEMNIKDFESSLHLFEQVSWIFCNGRNDFRGNETPCDEMAWIKDKKFLLKEAVALICKHILPKGVFSLIFLLMSPVDLPIAHTFYEFFSEMQGHDDIICISESEENYSKWEGYAQFCCDAKTVRCRTVAGMKMSHVDATVQQLQPFKTRASRHLPVLSKGVCLLQEVAEERLSSIEILCVDQCDNTSNDFMDEIVNIEEHFYRGGKVSWMNFWLAENKHVGDFIERDTYKNISKIINEIPKWNPDQMHVFDIRIYHQPGSGGSTVARHVLWSNRKYYRCAVVKHSFPASTVADHAVKLREYEESDTQKCLPVLLVVEDTETEYLDDLRKELELAVRTKKIKQGTLCFILLSCRQSCDPVKMCKESPLQNFSVTHKLSVEEKKLFLKKRTELQKQFSPDFIITFVMMSKEFDREYISRFVQNLLKDIDRSSVVTRLILYVALLNTYVQNSYLSQSHCEALLLLTMQTNEEYQESIHSGKKHERFRRHLFESSLSEQAKVLFIHLRDDKTNIQCVRMIHPLIAEEVLGQPFLSGQHGQQQSEVALKLLGENVLFENTFGKLDYHKFLRHLCIRRSKLSRGDKSDTSFSPLIEHVLKNESQEQAVQILEEAYKRFGEDGFFAQQLARLYYTNEEFPKAKDWADIAQKKIPNNSYILDTKGHVYKRWFNYKRKMLKGIETAENTVDAIETALDAIDCFRTCQEVANSEPDTMNNSGYFSEVEVEFDLVELIFKVFPNGQKGRSECQRYLITDYIPDSVRDSWKFLHSKLKFIHKNMHEAIDRISEDLSYFQTDVSEEDNESYSSELKVKNPISWLAKKTVWYGKTFAELELPSRGQNQLTMRMKICSLGGDNITTIFSLLSEKKQIQLEAIVDLYGKQKNKLDQTDLVNYIASQIALGCLSSTSTELHELQTLSKRFPRDGRQCHSNTLFLLTLLFWPEDDDSNHDRDVKYDMVMSATDALKKRYNVKKKEIPNKELRVFTHFYLGKGKGLSKIIHKSKIQPLKTLTVSQKRMKWYDGYIWKTPQVAEMLKYVQGWAENGNVYIKGSEGKRFEIMPLHAASVPDGNENVEFFLGFTFKGPAACGIRVCSSS